MVLDALEAPSIVREGTLGKMGGGAGGTKNWKDRFFVLSDHLYYYNAKKDFEKDPSSALGRVNLTAYYVSRDEKEFTIHAYPKVRGVGAFLLRCLFL
jgi:hypothetical protein